MGNAMGPGRVNEGVGRVDSPEETDSSEKLVMFFILGFLTSLLGILPALLIACLVQATLSPPTRKAFVLGIIAGCLILIVVVIIVVVALQNRN